MPGGKMPTFTVGTSLREAVKGLHASALDAKSPISRGRRGGPTAGIGTVTAVRAPVRPATRRMRVALRALASVMAGRLVVG
jgi:hypothetical protein